MIFTIYPDGKTYPAREMLEALEYAQRNLDGFNKMLSICVSNSLQI